MHFRCINLTYAGHAVSNVYTTMNSLNDICVSQYENCIVPNEERSISFCVSEDIELINNVFGNHFDDKRSLNFDEKESQEESRRESHLESQRESHRESHVEFQTMNSFDNIYVSQCDNGIVPSEERSVLPCAFDDFDPFFVDDQALNDICFDAECKEREIEESNESGDENFTPEEFQIMNSSDNIYVSSDKKCIVPEMERSILEDAPEGYKFRHIPIFESKDVEYKIISDSKSSLVEKARDYFSDVINGSYQPVEEKFPNDGSPQHRFRVFEELRMDPKFSYLPEYKKEAIINYTLRQEHVAWLKDNRSYAAKVVDDVSEYFNGAREESDFIQTLYDFMVSLPDYVSFMELSKAFQVISKKEVQCSILATLGYMYQLSQCNGAISVYVATQQYVLALYGSFPRYLEKVCKKFVAIISGHIVSLRSLVNRYFNRDEVVHSQSFADKIDVAQSFLGHIIHSDIFNSMRDLLLSLISVKLFSKDVSKNIVKVLGAPKRMCLLELISTITDAIGKFASFVGAFMSGESLSTLLLSENPVSAGIHECRTLLTYSERLYTGLPTPGMMCRREFYNKAKSLHADLSIMVSKMNQFDPQLRAVKACIEGLHHAICEVESQITSSKRQTPIAIILAGSPGIGKSLILPMLARIYSLVKGREFSEDQIYNRDTTSVYWEGYLPQSHPYIHYSEVGNDKLQRAMITGDPILSEILSLVDSLAKNCNMAFQGKGKVRAHPDLVLLDTNNPSLNASIMHSPGAVLRRFILIEAVVLEEFRLPNSTSLDSKKSLEVGGNLLDRYKFSVSKHIAIGNEAAKVPIMEGNIYALIDFLCVAYAEHIALQDSLDEEHYTDVEDYVKQQCEGLLKRVKDQHTDKKLKRANDKAREVAFQENLSELERWIQEDKDDEEKAVAYAEAGSDGIIVPLVNESTMTMALRYTYVYYMYFLAMIVMCLNEYFKMLFSKSDKKMKVVRLLSSIVLILCYYFFARLIGCFIIACLCVYFNDGTERPICAYFSNAVLSRFGARCAFNAENALNLEPVANPVKEVSWKKSVAVLAGTGVGLYALFKLYKFFQGDSRPSSESHSNFRVEDKRNELINDFEEKCGVQNGIRRVKVQSTGYWTTIFPSEEVVCTDSPVVLSRSIARNVRKVDVICDDKTVGTTLFGVCSNYAVINKHSFRGKFDRVLHIYKGFQGEFDVCTLTDRDCVDMGNDVLLIRTGNRFYDMMPHIRKTLLTDNAFGAFLGDEVRVNIVSKPMSILDDYEDFEISSALEYNYASAVSLCGTPLTVSTANGATICGIHCAGRKGAAFAVPILHDQLRKAVEELDSKSVLLPIFSEGHVRETLCDPHAKSPFKYTVRDHLQYYGNLGKGICIKNDSKLVENSFAPVVKDILRDEFKHEIEVECEPPMMQPKKVNGEYHDPYSQNLDKMNKPIPDLDSKVLEKVIEVYTHHIVLNLSQRGVHDMHPWSVEEAVNGIKGDDYFGRIDASKSGGHGFPGVKGAHIPIVDDEIEDELYREPVSSLKSQLYEIFQSYYRRVCFGHIFKGQLKDEPRELAKARSGGTRVFFMSSLSNLIFARMFLGPLYTAIVEHRDVFCTAVGINMHKEADEFVRNLLEFSHLIMEGDYSGFDVSNPVPISRATNTIMYNVAKHFGYNDDALLMLQGLLSDGIYPVINMNNDVFFKPGMQPSGKYGTAEDNSIRGIVMLMYAWYANPQLADKNFFDYVLPVDYGDDLLAAVKPEVSVLYNNSTYQMDCKRYFNMGFTSASKSSELSNFVDIHTMSFLKRKFSYHHGLQRYVAKLSLDSVYKSMQWRLPSKSITREQQVIATAVASLWELFFHSENDTQYERIRRRFAHMLGEHFGVSSDEYLTRLPSYEGVAARILADAPELEGL